MWCLSIVIDCRGATEKVSQMIMPPNSIYGKSLCFIDEKLYDYDYSLIIDIYFYDTFST